MPAADRREGAAELGGVLSVQSGVRHDAAAARVGLLHVQWPRALPRGQGVHGVAGAHAREHHGAWRVRRFISSLPISLPHPPHSPPTCEALQYRVYHVAALSFSLSSPRRRRAEVRLLPPCQPNARGDCVHCTPLQETIRHGLAEAQMPPMPWWVLSRQHRYAPVFEQNLQVWRQLWRVVERADVVVVVMDVRHPLLHLPPALYLHVARTLAKPLVRLPLTTLFLIYTTLQLNHRRAALSHIRPWAVRRRRSNPPPPLVHLLDCSTPPTDSTPLRRRRAGGTSGVLPEQGGPGE